MAAGVLDLPTLVQKVRVSSDTAAAEGQTRGAMTRIGEGAVRAGKAMSVGLTVPIVGLAISGVKAASDLSESMSKVKVVFGENAAEIEKWSKTTAASMGVSQQAALEAVGTFGNLFRAMGLGQNEAAGMSQKLVGLASDLASFNNADPAEVLEALRSGLVGETEPLRRFGVSLSAARVEAIALAEGMVEPTKNAAGIKKALAEVEQANAAVTRAQREHGESSKEFTEAQKRATDAEVALGEATKGAVPELTAAQKAQAAYAGIMKDTTLAQGDFGRTAGGLANQQRILAAQFENAKASLGSALLPVALSAVSVFVKLLGAFNALPGPGKKIVLTILGIVAALGPALIVMGKMVTAAQTVGPAFLKVGKAGGAVGKGGVTVVKAAGQMTTAMVRLGAEAAKGTARMAAAAAKAAAQTVVSLAKATAAAIASGARMVASFIATAASAVASAAAVAAAWIAAALPFIALGLLIAGVVIAVIKNWDTIKAATIAVWNAIKTALSAVWAAIKVAATAVFEAIRAYFVFTFNVYRTIILGTWFVIRSTLVGIWTGLQAVAGAVFGAITAVIGNAVRGAQVVIGAVWSAVTGYLTRAWRGLQVIAGVVWGAITAVISAQINGVKAVIHGVISAFDTLKDTVVRVLTGIADFIAGIIDRITGPLQGVANLLGKVVGGVGGLVGKIPGLQHGGRAFAGRPVWTGEAGPELMFPDSNATVVSNDDIRRALANSVPFRPGATTQVVDARVSNTFEIAELHVREEGDIRKVAKELHRLQTRDAQSRGERPKVVAP